MTDLINKVDDLIKNNDKLINEAINNFSPVLDKVKYKNDIPYLSYIIYLSVDYIKNNDNLSKDWKAWSIVVVKKMYLNGKINNEADIKNIINDFIEHYKQEYEKYCDNIISATDFDRDYGFVLKYVNKKNR